MSELPVFVVRRGATMSCRMVKVQANPYSIKVVHRIFNPRVRVQFPIWIFLLYFSNIVMIHEGRQARSTKAF
jgi:hypothetical protein